MKDLPEPTFVYDPAVASSHARHLPPTLRRSKREQRRHQRRLNKNGIDPLAEPKKPGRWKKIVLIILGVIMAAAVAVGLYLFLHISKITSNPFSFGSKLDGEDSGRVNILLLGIGDPGHDGEKLSDTNIVASLNTRTNQVALISLPRDLRVKIPGHGYNKINTANEIGDVPLARQVVEQTTGLKINYYVRADFTGLKQIVDAVGGIDVDNKTLLYDPEYPCDNNESRSCGYRLPPGHYHLDGTAALKYARCRKGTCGSDFGRDQRQQEVLQKVEAKALTVPNLINPSKFNALLNSVSNNVKTDLSLANMKRLYDLSKKFNQNPQINVVFDTSPGGFLQQDPHSSDLLPVGGDFSQIQQFCQNVFKYGPVYSERPQIAIENGTSTVGLAMRMQTKIVQDGQPIAIDSVSNAPTRDYTQTQLIDYSGGSKPNTLNYLQGLLGVKATPPTNIRFKPGYDFLIIVGSNDAQKLQQYSTDANSSSSSGSSGSAFSQ